MTRLLFSSAAIAALLAAGPAIAADQAVRPIYTKAPPIPVFTWTGGYIGINGGGHWAWDNISTTTVTGSTGNFNAASAAVIDLNSPVKLKPDGWLVGGQVGYNIQVNHIVLGLEGDADWVGGSASRSLVFPGPVPTAGDALSNSTEGTFLATFRPRMGYGWDRALIYATGGLGIGRVKTTDSMSTFGGTVFESTSNTTTRVGWVAGGGIEYAFIDNWSFKVEGLHVDLGGTYDTAIPCAVCAAGVNDIIVHHKYTDNIVRVGLNYYFWGAPAPVVTKY